MQRNWVFSTTNSATKVNVLLGCHTQLIMPNQPQERKWMGLLTYNLQIKITKSMNLNNLPIITN